MIFVDDSEIKVGGYVLPGLIQSLDIKDDAHVEEQEVEGSSKKAKQAQGYEDAKITITLILEDGPTATKLEKLDIIQNLFKKAGQEKPEVHELINEHTAARRVKTVIFKSLSTRENNKKTQMTASLEFWAYTTYTITAKKITSGTTTTTTTLPVGSLDAAFQSYLNNKSSTASGSPAVDDQPTAAQKAMLGAMPF